MTDARKPNIAIDRRQFLTASAAGAVLLSGRARFRVATTDALSNLVLPGANWGIWIDNRLVNPGEAVWMMISVPSNTPSSHLPTELKVHQRYLEDARPEIEAFSLRWEKSLEKNLCTLWSACIPEGD